jgi:hypothetical protein
MTGDHGSCRYARFDLSLERWQCQRCETVLGHGSLLQVGLVAGLVPRPKRHDGLRTFGLGDRARLRGRTPAARPKVLPRHRAISLTEGGTTWRGREFYLYCPGPDCGAGQHLRMRDAEDARDDLREQMARQAGRTPPRRRQHL